MLRLLPLLQVICVVLSATIEYQVRSTVGLIFPLLALLLVTFLVYLRVASQREKWPQRGVVLGLASRSGLVFGIAASTGYVCAFFSIPEQFDFAAHHLFWVVPLLSGAAWLGVTIIGICVGDTVATMYKVHPSKKEKASFRDFPY